MTETNDAPERLSDDEVAALIKLAEASDAVVPGVWGFDPPCVIEDDADGAFINAASPVVILSMARELQRLRAATTPRPIETVPLRKDVLVYWGINPWGTPVFRIACIMSDEERPSAKSWFPLPKAPAP